MNVACASAFGKPGHRARIEGTESEMNTHMPDTSHISDDDLDRYATGVVRDEQELVALEEHLMLCAKCRRRATQIRQILAKAKKGV